LKKLLGVRRTVEEMLTNFYKISSHFQTFFCHSSVLDNFNSYRRLPNVQTKRLIHIFSKLLQVEVSFFGAKRPHSYPAYEGLPAAADFLFKKSQNIAKNHQILQKLAVSQQNKTYVVSW
jgi:hypothetical protein